MSSSSAGGPSSVASSAPAADAGASVPTTTVLACTRIHGQEAASKQSFDASKLRSFLRSTLAYAAAIVVAVDVADVFLPSLLVSVTDVVKEFAGSPIHVLPVTPWGRFVPALNAAISFAVQRNFAHILFLSLEMNLTPQAFDILWQNFDPQIDLVVGAALEGHAFQPGLQPLTGTTTPWNTCALWSVAKLSLTGFLLLSDGLMADKGVAGVEEVAAIALAQNLRARQSSSPAPSPSREAGGGGSGGGMRAKLLNMEGHVSWKVDWDDPARQEWHKKKMASKKERAGKQLEALGLEGHVLHEDVRERKGQIK